MNATAQYLLDLNRRNSEEFVRAALERELYKAKHPTQIMVTKCMDGRCNATAMTHVLPGILQPMRTLGGRFSLGWSHFNDLVREWVTVGTGKGQYSLVLNTYHFSKSEKHLGCRGFNYDTEAAVTATMVLRDEFVEAFNRRGVYPVVVGIETDEEALVLHGWDKQILRLAEHVDLTEAELTQKLNLLYPDMPAEVLHDLLPLILGNLQHIQDIRNSNREPIALEHNERAIALGRGFDWLHSNLALIIGPYIDDLDGAIRAAAGIVLSNIKEGRVDPKDGIVLIASTPAADPAFTKLHMLKSRYLAARGLRVIEQDVPDLVPYLTTLVGVVDSTTRKLQLDAQE